MSRAVWFDDDPATIEQQLVYAGLLECNQQAVKGKEK